jgi:prolyl 4-hydroxylase
MESMSTRLGRWMAEQAAQGAGPEALRSWALSVGFEEERVEAELRALRQSGVFQTLGSGAWAQAGMGQWRLEGDLRCLAWMRWPNVALFDGLVDAAQASAIVEAARPGLSASLVAAPLAARSSGRRSASKSFARGFCQQADALQDRIARMLALDPSRLEPLQATLYGSGGFYAPHRDHFPETHPKWESPGQRVATVVVYLAEPSHGGQTVMDALGLRFAPRMGLGLYFAYGDEASRDLSLHSSAPCEGEKWIATQWIKAEQ